MYLCAPKQLNSSIFSPDVDCGGTDLGPILNGQFETSGTTLGAIVTYSCDTGYTLAGNNGNSQRICQSNSTWSGTRPQCLGNAYSGWVNGV